MNQRLLCIALGILIQEMVLPHTSTWRAVAVHVFVTPIYDKRLGYDYRLTLKGF